MLSTVTLIVSSNSKTDYSKLILFCGITEQFQAGDSDIINPNILIRFGTLCFFMFNLFASYA